MQVKTNLGLSFASLAGVALAFGLSATSLAAQQADAPQSQEPSGPSSNATEPSQPSLTVRNQKVLESFEPAASEEYTLGSGDQISLDFPGRPELNDKTTVGPDGMITLKFAGAVHVADLTRVEVGKAVVGALTPYYKDLEVTVSIDKYAANKVRVIGYVQHPGEILFEETPTLLNAIGRAGLISPTVTSGGVTSNVGSGIPETCTIYRGTSTSSKAVEVNLREMLMTGNALADLRLRRNDIVFVPEPKHQFVSVLGQVGKPGSIPITGDSTLTSVLAEAGCCSENGGFNPRIHILQRSSGKDITVEYKKLMTLAGQKEYTIHPGDVIFVPVSGFNKVTSIMQKISPVATMVSIATLVGAG